jgi:hypothetical protein
MAGRCLQGLDVYAGLFALVWPSPSQTFVLLPCTLDDGLKKIAFLAEGC